MRRKNAFWIALAAPGIIWLVLLFIVPFYAVLAIAWASSTSSSSPRSRSGTRCVEHGELHRVCHDLAGRVGLRRPDRGRTSFTWPWPAALACSSPIRRPTSWPGSPAAEGAVPDPAHRALLDQLHDAHARLDRPAADQRIREQNLSFLHLISQPVNWLGGCRITVVLGLVYGYIPYLILVLYAGLDRIDPALIEAGRDLGLGRARTFVRITLPLSRQPILTGMLITVLPMLGDYYTNQLLSGATSTSMFGNVIQDQLGTPGSPGRPGRGVLAAVPARADHPMIYYVIATNRSSQGAT